MPKCPGCKEEIDDLHVLFGSLELYSYNGEEYNKLVGKSDARYFCPTCYEVIADSEEEANKFLLNE
jgi:hypothetical protein